MRVVWGRFVSIGVALFHGGVDGPSACRAFPIALSVRIPPFPNDFYPRGVGEDVELIRKSPDPHDVQT